jgi:type II secretory pathway component PulF
MAYTGTDKSKPGKARSYASDMCGEELFSAPDVGDDFAWKSFDAEAALGKRGRWGSIRKQDVAEVTSQLAIMTRSGVDVATALASLASQCQKPALAEVLLEVHQSVLAGNSLSNALRSQAHVFEPSFIAAVAAGEASGRMSEVLRQLAQVQRSEIRSRRTMRALMTYPILLLTVSFAVITCLVLFVLPRFAQIFLQYELTLPIVTQMLMALAAELRTRWWLWFPLLVGIVGVFLTWRSTIGGRRRLDALWLQLPVIKTVYRPRLVGRMCRLFGLMLESGIPLLDVLRLTKQGVANVHYQELIDEMEDAVVNGRNLSSALHDSEIVPESAREMLTTAESTGNLGEVTQLLGEYYDEEAEARMRQVVGLLEPVITIGMGVIVAVVVLAVMLPVFDLSTIAQRGH